MITKEHKNEKICLFCANDYHLEMILLPYIKERLEKSKFIIFTENNLEETIKILLTKVNLKEKTKKQIINIDWANEKKLEKLEQLKKLILNNEKINVVINGDISFIREINNKINEIKETIGKQNFKDEQLEIIDCFHVGDTNVDIEEIKTKYKYILNTQKIEENS